MYNKAILEPISKITKKPINKLRLFSNYTSSIIGVSLRGNIIYDWEELVFESLMDGEGCSRDDIDFDLLEEYNEYVDVTFAGMMGGAVEDGEPRIISPIRNIATKEEDIKDYIDRIFVPDSDAYDIGDFYDCVVGFEYYCIAYDYNKIIKKIQQRRNVSAEEAADFFKKEIIDNIDCEEENIPIFLIITRNVDEEYAIVYEN